MQKKRIDAQQKQLEAANKELEQMVYIDSLTGLPNRRFFDDTVSKEVARMSRKGHESCLILLDIDFFKKVNDKYGHPAGDALLIEIGKLLGENTRQVDTICRLGGEEFLILLPHTTLAQATITAEKLRNLIEHHVFNIGNKFVFITASFGVAKLMTDQDETLTNQYSIVDHAMYLAKQSGRNCVRTL